MPDLRFEVEGVEAVAFSATPLLVFKLRVTNRDPQELVQSVALRCQLQIESTHRKYSPAEQDRLLDLFGEPERWSRTLRPMLWTHANVTVKPFQGSTLVELPVTCTFDFNVAATKYFAGLDDGEVPLNLMFSGTIFYEPVGQGLQIEQVPWDRECRYRFPISVWKEMMEIYYPNSAWLCLRRDTFDKLAQYKMDHGMTTWEQALESILPAADFTQEPDDGDVLIESTLPS
ncbi:MAG TPA: DUF6084 family protein [Pyrinomonadaceae bacterium]|nr:DUF6084 family protein [Pyrinomonadaceae bacterium]